MLPNFIWALIGFTLILTPVILIHELGHFWAAKLSNIKVEEFGLGFPPRAMTLFERNGTKYTLNWIPVGGFVRPAGEDNPEVEGGLASASPGARFFVLIAGSLMNFILAIILLTIMFMLPRAEFEVGIDAVAANSPAELAGIQPNDVIVSINGFEIMDDFSIVAREVQGNAGEEIAMVLRRGSELVEISLVPRLPGTYDATQEGSIGIIMTGIETGTTTSFGPIQSVTASTVTIGTVIYETVTLPGRLIREEIAPADARVVSVVGISQMAGAATQSSVENRRAQDILWMMGIISVALGFTNLLPLPALDGGRLVFVILEMIRGKRVLPEREGVVHAVGMMLLLTLMVVLIIQDIINPINLP